MKKWIALILTLILVLGMVGCGKSEAVKQTEEAINAIGIVTLDAKDAIEFAERMYNTLTDKEKEKVSNRLILVEARTQYDRIRGIEDGLNGSWDYDMGGNTYAGMFVHAHYIYTFEKGNWSCLYYRTGDFGNKRVEDWAKGTYIVEENTVHMTGIYDGKEIEYLWEYTYSNGKFSLFRIDRFDNEPDKKTELKKIS